MFKTKTLPLVIVAALVIVGALSLGFYNPSDATTDSAADNVTQVQILNFHATHRCATCVKIEKLARASVAELKKDGVQSDAIKYKLLDVTKEQAMAKKYEAFGTALHVVAFKSGKRVYHADFTEKAFMLASDATGFKSKFKRHLKTAYQKIK